jgi:monoterpene epsilon-lactone hydrolase
MTISPAERRIRGSLPIIRFMQVYMPHWLAGWVLKKSTARVKLGPEVKREHVVVDGVACEWIMPDGSPEDKVLLYLHGGGFVMGLSPLHLPMVAALAKKMRVCSLIVDYRLAPEHPFPAALEDSITAYRWLLKRGTAAQNIVVAGDSAGGNLAITSMMKLRDERHPLPAAAACLSPVADLSGENAPPKGFKDPLLPARAVRYYNRSYVGYADAHNPYLSPAFGDWHDLPPLLIHVGEDERLREDALRMVGLARSAGVDVRLEIYPRMWHVWQLYMQLPQAIQSLDDIAAFLKAYLETNRSQPGMDYPQGMPTPYVPSRN